MKQLELKAYKEKMPNGREDVVTTLDCCLAAIKQPPQDGWKLEAMRKRFKILDILEAQQGAFQVYTDKPSEAITDMEISNSAITIELEDTDMAELKTAMKAMRWGVLSRSVMDILEQFEK